MLDRIILLSGQISAGKSTLANGLAEYYGIEIFKTSDFLKGKVKASKKTTRNELQDIGDSLDRETNGKWLSEELDTWISEKEHVKGVIVDSVRIKEQIKHINEEYWPRVTHIHLTAPPDDLKKRFSKRQKNGLDTEADYNKIKQNQTEKQIEELSNIADLVIDTKRSTNKDVLIRATSFIDIPTGNGQGYVDVIVGGQYGSEGKGQISGYLSNEYDLLVRVGGPNAGHSVYEGIKKSVYHQIPSGANLGSKAKLLIGPGAVINPETLLKEMQNNNIDETRLSIDRNVMVITEDDQKAEKRIVQTIGSTGQGVGSATARRIIDRGGEVIKAKDVPELSDYIVDGLEILEKAYKENKRILLEGTQGTGLSLYHGQYPHVTSRDTTVSACLSEAGVSPMRVRRIIMVCRTYPIRVQNPDDGSSGKLNEISWEEVAKRSRVPLEDIKRTEVTTTTGRERRVGEFEWNNVHRAGVLNGATDIALTFTDYLDIKNSGAIRFEQLTEETLKFIQEVERVTGTPVSLISTGFNGHSIIDRRIW